MVDRNEAFVREVDEDLRRDQIQQLLQRYGTLIAAGALLLLAAIGGYKYWDGRRQAQAEAAGARFSVAAALASSGQSEEALKQFEDLAKGGSGGYPALARMQLAGARVKDGKPEAALPLYEALAKDTSVDPVMRDFAALQAAMLRLDVADWTEMTNRLTPLMSDSSAWRAMARETLGLAAYKAGQTGEARKLFEQMLSDRLTPPSVSERAFLMLSLLTDADAAKAAAGTAKADGEKPAAEKPADKMAPAQTTPAPKKK